jgi:hypothetical protein
MTVELFRRRSAEPVLGYSIFTILRKYLKATSGSVGIEVEVEGNKFPKPPGMESTHKAVPMEGWNFWHYVKDGSLRGQDNAEYVLGKPIEFEQVPEAVAELTDKLQAFGSKLDDSNRTSVHVHLNVQQFHMNRLTAFIALYLCFEEVLTEWCGDHRVGNLFCLRGKDAPGALTKIKRFIQSDGQTELHDNLHYAGLNTNALTKFGSLEIRTLRGPTDFSIIQDWVNILERLYKLSAEYLDPRDIPALFSQQGPLEFFNTVLGEQGPVLRAGIDFDDERVRDSMYEGIRLAQDLCYCRDWGNFKPVDLKDDPFGRDLKKVAKAMAYHEAYGGASAPGSLSQLQVFAQEYMTTAPVPSSPFSFNTLSPMVSPAPVEFEEPEQPEEYYEPDFDEE